MPHTHKSTRPQAGGLNVLVVEHDDNLADVEASLLATEDHAVKVACDVQAAVRESRDFQPDVVFLDLGLPELDGLQIARRLRGMDQSKRPMLIAVTTRDDDEQLRRYKAIGVDMHLVKPIVPETLCMLLRQFRRVLR
jgi:DNA-binding response OmpR family regulator